MKSAEPDRKQPLNSLGQPIGQAVPDWRGALSPSHEPLVGQHCKLAPLDPDLHASDLFTAFAEDSDGRIWTYLPYGPFASQDEYTHWIKQNGLGDDPLFFAIIDKVSQRVTGVASYLRINPDQGVIEVGHLCYSPALSQTTAATEAMYLMMKRAFELGYRRYEWKCNALNQPSRNAALRLGFQFEGVHRNAVIIKGHNRDTAWFSVIDEEWPMLEQAFMRWLAKDNFDVQGKQKQTLTHFRTRQTA